jgi:hypothetical protein
MDYDSNHAVDYQGTNKGIKSSKESVRLVKDDRETNEENYQYTWIVKTTRTKTDEEGVDHVTSDKVVIEIQDKKTRRKDTWPVKGPPNKVLERYKKVIKDGRDYAQKIIKSRSVISNEGCYIDMGLLYGGWVYENAIIWWPEPISLDKAKIDVFLTDFFSQLKRDGVSNIKYSFDQLCDIFKIINREPGVNTDTISPIYVDNYLVSGTEQNFLEYMTSFGLANGVTSTLSFGGALAGATEMTLPDDGVTCASALADFMKKTNIKSIDYDIEGAAVVASTDSNNLAFYEALKTQVNAMGGTVSVAVIGDINQFPEVFLKDFNSYFDRVNLMLYSNTQYYIDATGSLYTWSLDKWIQAVGNDPLKISIGFYDSIAYEDPASSAGEKYDIEGLTRGQAAASIYLQAAKNLGITVCDFASPFWWTDNPVTLSANTVLQDFYSYLDQHSMLKKNPRKFPPYKKKKFPIKPLNS